MRSRGSSSTLVIQTAFLGDVVLTTPLLSAIAEHHGPVDVVTTPAAATLLARHPAVRRVIGYDKRGAQRGVRGVLALAAALRRERYARVYLPHRSLRSAALALAARIPERIGFADAPAAATYTRRISRPAGVHETERLLALAGDPAARRLEGSAAAHPVSLALTEADRAEAETWLRARGIGAGFVAIAPGSIWGTKRWPYYGELAAQLPDQIVIVGGAEDADLAAGIAAAVPDRVHSAAGQLGLRASTALIERAGVLVTNDSAPLHLATAARTPIVAIFGPTVPEFGFGPLSDGDIVLGIEGLPCRPCSAHGPRTCPLGHHRCMRDLGVTGVLEAVRAITRGEERSALRARD